MAFVDTTNDQTQQQQQTAPMNQPVMTTSAGGGGAGSGVNPQGAAASPTSAKTPPVQDLKAYLEANAPQAVQMGQNIAQNLTNQAGQITGDINQAATDTSNQVAAQNVAPNQELVNQAAANPTEFVKNPQNVTDFLAQKNATYNGPSAWETTPEYTNVAGEVKNAVNAAPDITQPSGVASLVRGQEKNPTVGMQNLDTLLLQGNPDAMSPIKAAVPQVQALNDYLSGKANDVNNAIANTKANDVAAQGLIAPAFTTGPNAVVPTFQKNIQDEISKLEAERTNYNDFLSKYGGAAQDISKAIDAYNNVANSIPSLEVPSSIPGQKPSTIQLSQENPFSSFASMTPITAGVTAANASPEDLEYERALNTLLGTNLGIVPENINPLSIPDTSINNPISSYGNTFPGLINYEWNQTSKVPQLLASLGSDAESKYGPEFSNLKTANDAVENILAKYLNSF